MQGVIVSVPAPLRAPPIDRHRRLTTAGIGLLTAAIASLSISAAAFGDAPTQAVRPFWRQHLALIMVFGGIFLLQSGLIVALVFQSRRRHRAEHESRRRREDLAHMTRVSTVGELTASLAHEINQPLTAILSNAQAAMQLMDSGCYDPAEIRDILADIAADGARAGDVIRRMRTFLRKENPRPTDLDVNDIVGEVVNLVRPEMTLQDISLALDLAPNLKRVHGDRIQLEQVLLNLVVNALESIKEVRGGARRVLIRTAAVDARTVEVSVEDSGIGLPAARPEDVFEPFFTTKPNGLGLGLAICRSIVQAHGGRIRSRNNEGQGATFGVSLPVLEGARS